MSISLSLCLFSIVAPCYTFFKAWHDPNVSKNVHVCVGMSVHWHSCAFLVLDIFSWFNLLLWNQEGYQGLWSQAWLFLYSLAQVSVFRALMTSPIPHINPLPQLDLPTRKETVRDVEGRGHLAACSSLCPWARRVLQPADWESRHTQKKV